MDANQDLLQGKWPELKGQVRQQFGKLTAEDVERVRGRPAELVLLLRERYGYGQAQAEIEIDNWLHGSGRSSYQQERL
jgi:uncharacterized protein YjbJ (UPF0337 family)